jgi:hypothetical protein
VTTLDAGAQETTHRWPWFLPDGRHFLYVAEPKTTLDTLGTDIDTYLGSVQPELASWDMVSWDIHTSVAIRPRMNWKLVVSW